MVGYIGSDWTRVWVEAPNSAFIFRAPYCLSVYDRALDHSLFTIRGTVRCKRRPVGQIRTKRAGYSAGQDPIQYVPRRVMYLPYQAAN